MNERGVEIEFRLVWSRLEDLRKALQPNARELVSMLWEQRARAERAEAALAEHQRSEAALALAELRAEVAANPPPAESPPDGELEGRGLGGFRTWRE